VTVALGRAQWRALLVVWVTYGTFYFCRVNIGPARTAIQADVHVTALEIGFVLGAIKLGYAIGQLVNGQLVERFGAKRIVLLGMFGSAAATLVFASCKAIGGVPAGFADALSSLLGRTVSPMAALLVLVAFANGYFQAGGWPPTVKVMSNWFSAEQRGRMMGVIGTSYQLGSAVTIFAAGLLITAFGGDWRAAFVVPAALLAASGVHTLVRLRERPEGGGGAGPETGKAAPPERVHAGSVLWATVTNGRIWILAFGLFGLDLVRYGFLDWAPGQLQEAHHSGVTGAALKASVLPLAGALGALVSGWMSDRFFGSRRAPVITIMLVLVGVLTLLYVPLVRAGWLPTVGCLALIGFFLYGAQILLVGTAAQDFAKHGTSAAAAGFVDFTGSMGAFGGDIVTGYFRQTYGWDGAIRFWAVAALAAALLVAVLWRAKARSA
jgi:OPA family glycerol-3-phosphate transporter-like MFS transporter